jgi:hypothetical protein
MKKLILILFLAACNGEPEYKSSYETRYSPDGKDCVALIHYFDGHRFSDIYMNCDQFLTLTKDKLDYEAVYEYARTHELPAYWKERYSRYK